MGSTESKVVGTRMTQSKLANINLPNKFGLWYKGKAHIRLIIGADKNSTTHLITLPDGWHGDLIFYNGPTNESDPMAVVTYGSKMGWHDKIRLAAQPGRAPIEEEVRVRGNGWSMIYAFTVAIDSTSLPERFEWRSSRSDEVKELGEGSHGYKLVRLGPEEEIVAIAGNAKWTKSWTKAGAFQFRGRGATGELGEAWAIMAVVSFVRIVQRNMQAAVAASAAARDAGLMEL